MIIQAVSQSALLMVLYMGGWFIIAQIKKNNSLVVISRGLGCIILAWFSFFKNGAFLARHVLITSLVTLWGLRISGYIFIRNFGKKEDPRYTKIKKEWGRYLNLYSFLVIFMLQGFLILVISYPILVVNSSTLSGLAPLDYIGTSVWIFGYLFEIVADFQLYKFLKLPANTDKIMQSGLWKYSRHPNYFGEAVLWWGVWLISLSVPYGISALISPLTVTYLLMYVSGIPMAERQIQHLENFDEYKRRTSKFIPWFPRISQ